MRTLVHFGMPKTGTTTLQRTFALNADLLRSQGIYYPIGLQSSRANHRILAFCLMDVGSYPRHMGEFKSCKVSKQLFHELDRAIHAELARKRPDVLLLSSETLFSKIQRQKARGYRDWLHGLGGAVEFVAYLRSPASAYLASCQQKLRASSRIKSLKPHPYRSVIHSYEKVFSGDSISLVPFDRHRLIGADIVVDFCERYFGGCAIDVERLVRARDSNASLSAEAMALVMLYRRHFLAEMDDVYTAESKKLIALMRVADDTVGFVKPVLRDFVRPRLEVMAARDLLWLRDHHGFVFSDIDYDRLNCHRWRLFAHKHEPLQPDKLSEVVAINRCRMHALLDLLASTSFFKDSLAKMAWIRSVAKLAIQDI